VHPLVEVMSNPLRKRGCHSTVGKESPDVPNAFRDWRSKKLICRLNVNASLITFIDLSRLLLRDEA